jgi:PGF-CTERM protein
MTSNRIRSVGLAALVVGAAVFGAAALAGSAAAASNGSISADPAEPGAESTHTATLTVGTQATGSWNGFALDYSETDANVSDVGVEDVSAIGIDRGDDAAGTTIDVNVSDDLSSVAASNNGGTLTLGLGGSYSLNQSDEVVVLVDGVVNPTSEGEYNVSLDVNPQSSGGQGTATLAIGADAGTTEPTEDTTAEETTDSDNATTTTAPEETTTVAENTTESSGDAGDGSDGSDETTESGGTPGFGVGAALAALLAAGALLARRA